MSKVKLHPKVQSLKNSLEFRTFYKGASFGQPSSSKAVTLRSTNDNEDPRLCKQYFCVWGVKDDYGTMPIKGCFSKSLSDRGPQSNASYKITALYQHSMKDILAVPIKLIEDEVGLYGEVIPDKGVQVCDELVIRWKNGSINNGSYGFNYVWDKMEYDEDADAIIMKECELLEVSFVTIGAQQETHGVRSGYNTLDENILDDTEELIKKIPVSKRLEMRNLIERHISLAKSKPQEIKQALGNKPKKNAIDYDYLTKNLKF